MSRIIVAVPARINSSRLPGKILEDINGKPMIRRVLEKCQKAKGVDKLVVCTDTLDVAKTISSWGYEAILTATNCASGSERICSVIDKIIPLNKNDLSDSLVINVQGDLPYLDHKVIENMIELFNKFNHPPLLTPIYCLNDDEIWNPNIVKVILNKNDEAILFSRSALPFIRDVKDK